MPSQAPLVTCFIPAYNGMPYLREAVESIRAQTHTDWECLVFDDASSDGTWPFLQELDDPRFSVRRMEVNCDVAITGNMALKLARGRYFARMDQDDIALPDRFEAQAAFMEANPSVWVVGGRSLLFGQRDGETGGPLRDGDIKANLLVAGDNISNPASFVRLAPVKANGIRFDTRYPIACDYIFWVECMFAGGTFANLDRPVIKYRIHPGQTSRQATQIRQGVRRTRLQVLQKWFPFLTGYEMDAVEPLLHVFGPPRLTGPEVAAGLRVLDRLLATPQESVMGENRAHVLSYIRQMRGLWTAAVKRGPG
jgi:glycosyltransferase involved in cell wall biosynthesis